MGWWEDRAGLAGTVAIVTGGAGGLGEGITIDLAANGVKVAIVDRDEVAVNAIERQLTAAGATFIARIGDARDPDVLERVFGEVDDAWGRLDTLVNVVGGTFRAPFEGTSSRAWDALLRTNLGHVMHATSLAIPRMKAGGRGGSIINITTIEAHRAAPNFAVYSAAKAAVTHFARSLSVELAPDGIRVNNVAPDMTPTPNMMGISREADSPLQNPTSVAASIPMGRLGQITDISNAVVFLASGLASYITGSTLHPDGGALASSGWFNWPDEGFQNTLPVHVVQHLEGRSGSNE
jgi:3-oxoacyl-[acyl-carrier protein] reductase